MKKKGRSQKLLKCKHSPGSAVVNTLSWKRGTGDSGLKLGIVT